MPEANDVLPFHNTNRFDSNSNGLPREGTGCESFKIDQYEQTQLDSFHSGLKVSGLSDIADTSRVCDDQGNAYCE